MIDLLECAGEVGFIDHFQGSREHTSRYAGSNDAMARTQFGLDTIDCAAK
jgi:hypothetical protein